VIELVTETLFFTATVTSDRNDHVNVELSTRPLDDASVDVKMRQGNRRVWTFRFDDGHTITVDRADDEPFARALASRLGWVAPDEAGG
jgi:hypothetical protein